METNWNELYLELRKEILSNNEIQSEIKEELKREVLQERREDKLKQLGI